MVLQREHDHDAQVQQASRGQEQVRAVAAPGQRQGQARHAGHDEARNIALENRQRQRAAGAAAHHHHDDHDPKPQVASRRNAQPGRQAPDAGAKQHVARIEACPVLGMGQCIGAAPIAPVGAPQRQRQVQRHPQQDLPSPRGHEQPDAQCLCREEVREIGCRRIGMDRRHLLAQHPLGQLGRKRVIHRWHAGLADSKSA